MIALSWLRGLLAVRTGRLLGVAIGVALTVALIATLGAFMRQSAAEMSSVAVSTVPVDWQVQMVPGADPAAILAAAKEAAPVAASQEVGYADVTGFEFRSGDGTTQVTGTGKAVGIDRPYWTTFPKSARLLSGTLDGAVLQQQTAANLHAAPGDTIVLHRSGLPDVSVPVAGIIDLTNADTFFQAVGVPPGAAPQAPPDNAVFMPFADWHRQFDSQAAARPDSVRLQIHLNLDRAGLPADPADAFTATVRQGHNLEARVAGSAILGNNLAARLDAARGDAAYAYVLFLFLGSPGIVVAALLTLAVAGSGAAVRRRDQALLRLRGAAIGVLVWLAALEGTAVGLVGALIGVVLAFVVQSLLFHRFGMSLPQLGWYLATASAGLGLALAAILAPAWCSARQLSVAAERLVVPRTGIALWRRIHLDLLLLVVAALVFWRAGATGYQVVLAPEGVTAIAIDYTAFFAPFLFWIGGGLLIWRFADVALGRGRPIVTRLLAPAGALASLVAASLSRQRRRIAFGVSLTALAFAFASSTAIFDQTFSQQSRVDAELTNGADLTVTGTVGSPADEVLGRLALLPGVVAAEPMQHRFAYVGNDLQDLYGIDPANITQATDLSNAYFGNGDAAASLGALAARPDAVLVSDETVNDFQLNLGDRLNLRLQGSDYQYHVVPFTFAGIVREFPTAPRDSFLVANAGYVAKMTGLPESETVLMRVDGDTAPALAAARAMVAKLPGMVVTDLAGSVQQIGSSLTSIDLHGLTLIELGFSLLMIVAVTGLVLALGFADRRRTYAIMTALGATPRQVGSFILGEAAIVLGLGATLGLALGSGIAYVLVKVLEGVFDPPPERLAAPFGYLVAVVLAATAANLLTSWNAVREARTDPATELRTAQ
jgi:putative ABC transport system permease protein